MSKVTLVRYVAALAIIALAACSGQTSGGSGFAPAATSAITASAPGLRSLFQPLGSVTENSHCPGKDITCVTISYGYGATYYFCFIPSGSQCTGGQFSWSSTFHTTAGKLFKALSGSFYPNPGDPSTDYISETKPLASSHGKVKYQQTIFACLSSGCEGPYNIGIITQ